MRLSQKSTKSPEFTGIVETAKRLKNILKDWNDTEYDEKLFAEGAEREFFGQVKSTFEKAKDVKLMASSASDFASIKSELEELIKLTPHAESYFDSVMVNVDDEKIRSNRKNFLSWLLDEITKFADFTQIAI